METKDFFKFENVIKMVGNINKGLYGQNPFEDHSQDKKDLEKFQDEQDYKNNQNNNG